MPRRPALAVSAALLGALALAAAGPVAAGPVAGSTATAGTGSSAAPAEWVRVTLADRPTTAQVEALLATGVPGLQYVATAAYVAAATPAQVEALRTVDGVTGVRAVTVAERTGERLAGVTGTLRLQVLAAPGADAVARVAALGAVRTAYAVTDAVQVVEVTLPGAALGTLLRTPGVLYADVAPTGLRAEDEGAGQVLAGAASGTAPIAPGYSAFLQKLGLSGAGVVMSVVDDGLDATHPELSGRIVKRFSYFAEDQVVPAQGHGTHVAGILGGKGAEVGPAGVRKDSAGLQYGLGIAPGVRFVDQPLIQLANTTVNEYPPVGGFAGTVKDALSAGAVGWNGSWTDGGGTGVGYPATAAQLDGLTRDGDPAKPGHQPFTLVFSAGNSGSAANTITSPKELKNGIVVAASRGHRAGDVDDITSFSSRGPARDGRVVPTVTAPGEGIMSARAATGALCTANTRQSDLAPADGLGLYTGCSGTSMASPHVAGAVALIHEWWRKANGGGDPSPAMDRALLVNSAKDLKAKNVPNRDEGWGRVDLATLFDPTTSRVLVDQTVVLPGRDAQHALRVEAVDPAKPMRVTVAWTDVPGPVGRDRALVNDLDLVVTAADGRRFLGNDFVAGASRAGTKRDSINNVENVWLPQAGGAYDVVVRANDLPADGVPGSGTVTDQDFALVITNARIAG